MPLSHRLPARPRDLGELTVQRMLPAPRCRKVGPWIFADHFGPQPLVMDVPPHPHCGLSTVTVLFQGEIEHRDSTGAFAVVRPGEIHWMRAGHGATHTERTPAHARQPAAVAHGLQLWCAHPDGEEEQEPRFSSTRELVDLELDGAQIQLLAGTGWGQSAAVDVTSPLVYATVRAPAGVSVRLPDHAERALMAISGRYAVDGDAAGPGEMLVVDRDARRVTAIDDLTLVVLGGAPIGPRHMWWNLVHSDPGRLREQAERWRRGDFPKVVGDDAPPADTPPGP
jgi:redox-sensitive bicupin YhaK (pirin superfamily)